MPYYSTIGYVLPIAMIQWDDGWCCSPNRRKGVEASKHACCSWHFVYVAFEDHVSFVAILIPIGVSY